MKELQWPMRATPEVVVDPSTHDLTVQSLAALTTRGSTQPLLASDGIAEIMLAGLGFDEEQVVGVHRSVTLTSGETDCSVGFRLFNDDVASHLSLPEHSIDLRAIQARFVGSMLGYITVNTSG